MMGQSIKLKFNAYALFSGWEPTLDEEAQIHDLITPMLQSRGIDCESVIWVSQARFTAMGVLDSVIGQPPHLSGDLPPKRDELDRVDLKLGQAGR